MCGIAGVLYRDGHRPLDQTLDAMAKTIAHRGPDGQGVKALEHGCGLAHRRLAIIDLSPSAAEAAFQNSAIPACPPPMIGASGGNTLPSSV